MWDRPTPAWQTGTGATDRRADERTGQTGEGVADRRKILGSALFRRKCPLAAELFLAAPTLQRARTFRRVILSQRTSRRASAFLRRVHHARLFTASEYNNIYRKVPEPGAALFGDRTGKSGSRIGTDASCVRL